MGLPPLPLAELASRNNEVVPFGASRILQSDELFLGRRKMPLLLPRQFGAIRSEDDTRRPFVGDLLGSMIGEILGPAVARLVGEFAAEEVLGGRFKSFIAVRSEKSRALDNVFRVVLRGSAVELQEAGARKIGVPVLNQRDQDSELPFCLLRQTSFTANAENRGSVVVAYYSRR
jgi:hypothetical protein